jgi:hypothetical protein
MYENFTDLKNGLAGLCLCRLCSSLRLAGTKIEYNCQIKGKGLEDEGKGRGKGGGKWGIEDKE